MLKSYTAIYKQGQLAWQDEIPPQDNVQVIVTFMEPSKTIPETVASGILRQAWGAVEQPQTIAQIDQDIAAMRSEWE